MIEIEEAQTKVIENTSPGKSVVINIMEALNYVLSKELYSPINLPLFNQSAMDGYAVNGEYPTYRVVGKIKAGDNAEEMVLNDRQAFRIFTGAMLPDNTSKVIMQEQIEILNNGDIAVKENTNNNQNIRFKGEELKMGDVAIQKGTIINSAAIGLVSTLGISELEVYEHPSIQVIETGSELIQPGEPIVQGKIYGSNGIMIKSVLQNYGFDSINSRVADDLQETKKAINSAINTSEVVIITGGISVGDYDFVEQTLMECQVEKVFYKINQKPGKPMFYGRKDSVHIFALPGNPAAALTCFFMYVLPCLKALSGHSKPLNESKFAALTSDFMKKGMRTYLLKGYYHDGLVDILTGQSSAMLSAFVEANCLIKLGGIKSDYKKGDMVECYPII
ncbi:MAG: molybdopterin molybdotransferase MoeA [Crocinitomicaceae bacterium]|nr:molybdopterin molybdotransferase MoeA [Crocinitomicaceae bacterium]